MSAATPDHIVRAIWNNARGIGKGALVNSRKDAVAVMEDLGGWVLYAGQMIDITPKPAGAGMYYLTGSPRY